MLQKDVTVALIKGSTVFVNYLAAWYVQIPIYSLWKKELADNVITSAHDEAIDRKQKTITASHVMEAVTNLGWDAAASSELEKQLRVHLAG